MSPSADASCWYVHEELGLGAEWHLVPDHEPSDDGPLVRELDFELDGQHDRRLRLNPPARGRLALHAPPPPTTPRCDWRSALTTALAAVTDGRPSTPTFDDVVTRPHGFEMNGRFATTDGGAGTFKLARLLADGPWFVTSLQDDAFHVRDVEVTRTEARVTIVIAEGYHLAMAQACGGSAASRSNRPGAPHTEV